MARLEQALIYWCCQELSAYRARHLTFELSGSDVPGEGEVKILEWLLDRNCSTSGSVALVGGDGDLVLQALTRPLTLALARTRTRTLTQTLTLTLTVTLILTVTWCCRR